VGGVARLLPRHWDGRRLLRFLTGLALLALAFAVPAAAAPTPAPAAITATVTVDAPTATAELAVRQAEPATEQAEPATEQAESPKQAGSSTQTGSGSVAGRTSASRADECWHDASGTRAARLADATAKLAGVTPGVPGSRGPPRS
jgi:hypothetical protein